MCVRTGGLISPFPAPLLGWDNFSFMWPEKAFLKCTVSSCLCECCRSGRRLGPEVVSGVLPSFSLPACQEGEGRRNFFSQCDNN